MYCLHHVVLLLLCLLLLHGPNCSPWGLSYPWLHQNGFVCTFLWCLLWISDGICSKLLPLGDADFFILGIPLWSQNLPILLGIFYSKDCLSTLTCGTWGFWILVVFFVGNLRLLCISFGIVVGPKFSGNRFMISSDLLSRILSLGMWLFPSELWGMISCPPTFFCE